MKLYNVVIEVVDLVWADSEQDAIARFRARADEASIDPLGDTSGGTDRAFVSEPVESMGWEGDDDGYAIVEVDGVKVAETRRFNLGGQT